ncbi:unnamed protein product [Phaeothamnion confervicola]
MGKKRLCCEALVFAFVGALMTAIILELRSAGRDLFAGWFTKPEVLQTVSFVEGLSTIWSAPHEAATARSLMASVRSSGTIVAKPFYNFVYLIFTGDTEADAESREELRRIYGDYRGVATATDGAGTRHSYTLRVLFVARKAGAPRNGEVAGDVLYVDVESGYSHIAAKTRSMMAVVTHFDFDYLMKGDEDTFVCFNLLASVLHAVPPAARGRVYAGVPTACKLEPTKPLTGSVIRVKRHKWYDEPFIRHTLNGLDCYPVYMQGAFYVLAKPLVDLLHRGRDHLVVFGNEDTTLGSWLLGTNRELLPLGRIDSEQVWHCPCSHGMEWRPETANMTFYHKCKNIDQLRKCSLSRDASHQRALC